MKRTLLVSLIAVCCLATSAGAFEMLPELNPDYDYGYWWGPCGNPVWNHDRGGYGLPHWEGNGRRAFLWNEVNESELKHVWMSVTYDTPWQEDDWNDYFPGIPEVEYPLLDQSTGYISDGDWWWGDDFTVWYHWVLPYQPQHEVILLPDESYYWLCEWPDQYFSTYQEPWMYPYVTQVEFYTWCTPEPATMSLLTIGGLFMLKRRKR